MRRILGRLSLGIVKIGRHGDHGTIQVVTQRVFSAVTQSSQNFGTYFNRRLLAQHRLNPEHARVVDKMVGQAGMVFHIGQAATHKAFGRGNGVLGVG